MFSDATSAAGAVHSGGGGAAGARPRDPPRLLRDGGAVHRRGREHGVERNCQVKYFYLKFMKVKF